MNETQTHPKEPEQGRDVGYRALRLRNFTCFEDASFDFVPGINVLVGENGTGKTHVMKVLYACLMHQTQNRGLGFVPTLLQVMQTDLDKQAELVRFGAADGRAEIEVGYGKRHWAQALAVQKPPTVDDHLLGERLERPVFIPSPDMIGHVKGFTNLYDEQGLLRNEYGLDFDLTFRDLAHLLGLPKASPAPQFEAILDQFEKEVLKGKVEYDKAEQRFYLRRGNHRQPMPLVAEGLRKIATLLTLVRNGFIKAGTTLFWDEPEVNLNPSLMDEVARMLWVLVENGVQIFVASHSYLILNEIENWKPDHQELRFFALEPTDDKGVIIHPSATYLDIAPNKIEQQYAELYDRGIQKEIRTIKAEAISEKK